MSMTYVLLYIISLEELEVRLQQTKQRDLEAEAKSFKSSEGYYYALL